MSHSSRCAACAVPAPASNMPRVLALTGRGIAALAATERTTPADLFTTEQYDAIRKAGLDVFFVRADTLLGAMS